MLLLIFFIVYIIIVILIIIYQLFETKYTNKNETNLITDGFKIFDNDDVLEIVKNNL